MKLLMENWRKFVAETERTKNYGDLYLFENDSIQKVSFYDRFSTLNESDDDFELFLEQWEKSVDYIFNNLSEQEEEENYTATLQAGTQAFMLLQRGGAAVGKVMNFAKKLKDKGTLGKVGDIVLTGLAAAAAAVTINSLLIAGVDPAEFQQAMAQVADAAVAIDPSVGQAVEQVAQNPEAVLEVMPQLDQAVEQSTQQLSQVDNEAVQQVAQEAEKVSQQIDPEGEAAREQMQQWIDDALRGDHPDPPVKDPPVKDFTNPLDEFAEMFEAELAKERGASMEKAAQAAAKVKEVAEQPDPVETWEFWTKQQARLDSAVLDEFRVHMAREGTGFEPGDSLTRRNLIDIVNNSDIERIQDFGDQWAGQGEGLDSYADFWGMDEKETRMFKRLAKRKLRKM